MLCKVVNVQLRAEPDTDEVYAKITLLPDGNQTEVTIPDPPVPEPPRCTMYSFSKKLTASDLNTLSGFLLPRNADNCLPPLDMSQQPPSQELVAIDLHGNEWRFKHTLQGQPRRHLLSTGWSTFVQEKKLVSGDVLIFLRTSPSGFIISLNKYLKAQNHQLSAGMRFKMTFDGEDVPDRRFRGTIVGVADTSSSKCLVSEWRSVQVKWDDDEEASMLLPDRLSPWELELEQTGGWKCCCGRLSKLLCWK